MPYFNFQRFTLDEYEAHTQGWDLALGAQVTSLRNYPKLLILGAFKGQELVGTWALPQLPNGNLERPFRLLPYHAPVIPTTDASRRRKIFLALFSKLCEEVGSISIPLAPDCLDAAVLASRGALVEWRHTHLVDRAWWERGLNSRIKNHLKRAQKELSVSEISAHEFRFSAAIKGESSDGLIRRSAMGRALWDAGQAFCLRAQQGTAILGEMFIAMDDRRAYLVHSWFEKSKVRGIPSFLIIKSIEEALFQREMECFDFEGSVLPTVDHFFAGFNANLQPYAYLHWHPEAEGLWELTKKNIFSTERLDLQLTH